MNKDDEQMVVDIQNPFNRCQFDEVPADLFANESDHMPRLLSSDLCFSIRTTAISLISQVKLTYELDPFLVYLSVNYVDRFLAKQEIREKKPWIAHILVLASLSLASKMRNFDSTILLSELQRKEGFEFDLPSVHRMEMLLLATLQWRMRSITPFSFLQYFISLCRIEDDSQSVKRQASKIIFNVQHEIKLLQYKPSTIAASALLCSIVDLHPNVYSCCEASISSCEYVNKQALLECLSAMQEEYGPTENGMVRRQCTSSQSTKGFEGENAEEEQHHRRLNGVCENRTFQISQLQHC